MIQKESIGQDINVWDKDWEGLSPMSEIRMWDYFGMRHWISKYVPRNGKVLEAGCGMGRFVFYLSNFGIDIGGVDFSPKIISILQSWQRKHGYELPFEVGDVTNLKYGDNELSGYVSLGVVEHFIEGPHKPLKEAYRVLRPGGIAVITTPSYTFSNLFRDIKRLIYSLVKFKFRKNSGNKFYQYWYRPRKLKSFLTECGFDVRRNVGSDLLFAFYELMKYKKHKIDYGTFAYWFSSVFENTFLKMLGAQSVTVSVKTADVMHCFICGALDARRNSLEKFDVPFCPDCMNKTAASFYAHKTKVNYAVKYVMNPDIEIPHIEKCDFCTGDYLTDELFEKFGFTKNVCRECLKKPEINIELSCRYVMPVWRQRA